MTWNKEEKGVVGADGLLTRPRMWGQVVWGRSLPCSWTTHRPSGLCGPCLGSQVSISTAWTSAFDGWLVLEQHLYQDVSREGLPIHNRMPASQGPRRPHLCLRFAKLFWPRPVLYQSCAAFLLLLVLFMGRPFKLVGFGERAWEHELILGLDHP